MRLVFRVIGALAVAGCGSVDYDATRPGSLTGEVIVMWVGEEKFIYVPRPGNELTFVRPDGRSVVPDMIYTDGGSIPRPVQLLDGFSPWAYGPVYVLHDWLFVARACADGGGAVSPKLVDLVREYTFEDSYVIVAEIIRTLEQDRRVRQRQFAPRAITSAVAGPIARNAWNNPGTCAGREVSAEHRARVQAALFPNLRTLAEPAVIVGNIAAAP